MARRLLQLAGTLLSGSLICFFLLHAIPGDRVVDKMEEAGIERFYFQGGLSEETEGLIDALSG